MGDPPVYVHVRCTEPVLETLQPLCPQVTKAQLNWLADVTLGIGAGFSGMGEVCGAVSGAIMAIGIDFASKHRDTALLRLFIGRATQKFMRDFAKEFGSVRCKDIIGHDISGYLTPGDEAYEAFRKDATLRRGKCWEAIRFAIMYPLPSEQEE